MQYNDSVEMYICREWETRVAKSLWLQTEQSRYFLTNICKTLKFIRSWASMISETAFQEIWLMMGEVSLEM